MQRLQSSKVACRVRAPTPAHVPRPAFISNTRGRATSRVAPRASSRPNSHGESRWRPVRQAFNWLWTLPTIPCMCYVLYQAVTFAWSHRAEFFKIETFGDMHAAVCAVFSVVLFLAARCGDVLKPWTQGATKEDLAKAATKEDLDRIDKKQSEQMDNTEEQLLRRLDNLTEKVQAKTDLLDQVVVALAFRSINTVPTNCRRRFRL